MCIRYLGLVLLIWCPGELQAQSATQSCRAPSLDGGKFSPKRETYAHGTYVTYSCDRGRKPAVEGWWARSTCQNGTWSPRPQCIMEENCIPPKIPNAKYTERLTGWYEDGDKVRITCDEAYELKPRDATAVCRNGSWSSVPVCERRVDACGAPPKVPHAVIVDHGYQELFAADTELQYECEDGYTAEGAGDHKTIVCIAGAWTEGPKCSSATAPGTGQGGSTEGAAGGSGTQPAGRGTTPSTGHGGGSSDSSLQPAGGGRATAPGTGQGGSTEGAAGGSGTQPAGGGSSTTSDSNGRDSSPPFIPINNCGRYPIIPYAAVEVGRNYLRYRCDDYHTLVGSDTVVCQSNWRWSELPVCREKPCVLDPARYNFLKLSGFQRFREGEWRRFSCFWPDYNSVVECIYGQITYTQCCNPNHGHCP